MRLPAMVLILLVWAGGLGAAAQFGKISVLFEDLRSIYAGQSEVQLGLVVSVVGMVGLIFGTTAGLFASRFGAKRALVVALALGATVSVVQAFEPPYLLMIATRVLEGGSHLAIVVAGPILIAGLSSEKSRALAMTLWASFFGVAYALLGLIAPSIIETFGVSGLFWSHAAWMAILAVLLAVSLPADAPLRHSAKTSLIARHLAIYRSANIAAPAMGFCFYTFLYVACLTLLPPAAPSEVQSVMATGMPLISIVVSLTIGVWALSYVSAVKLVQLGYYAAIPGFIAVGLLWGTPWGMVIASLWLSSALGIAQGASFASIPELNDSSEDRAGAAGAVAQMGNLGTTLGTPILAYVLTSIGPNALVGIAILCCFGGVLSHRIQAQRRRNK